MVVKEVNSFDLGKDTTICEGENHTLTAPNATVYLWSTGSNNNSISVNQTGDYSVEITAANGCKKSDTINVKFEPCFRNHIEKDTLTICEGDSIIINATLVTNQVWGGTDGFKQINDSTIKVSPKTNAYYFIGAAQSNPGCKSHRHTRPLSKGTLFRSIKPCPTKRNAWPFCNCW